MSVIRTVSTEELQAELERRQNYPKIVAVGYLKEDMIHLSENVLEFDGWLMKPSAFNHQIAVFREKDCTIIPKGTKFEKLSDGDKDPGTWYDDINFGIENMDEDWAKANLEGITKTDEKA